DGSCGFAAHQRPLLHRRHSCTATGTPISAAASTPEANQRTRRRSTSRTSDVVSSTSSTKEVGMLETAHPVDLQGKNGEQCHLNAKSSNIDKQKIFQEFLACQARPNPNSSLSSSSSSSSCAGSGYNRKPRENAFKRVQRTISQTGGSQVSPFLSDDSLLRIYSQLHQQYPYYKRPLASLRDSARLQEQQAREHATAFLPSPRSSASSSARTLSEGADAAGASLQQPAQEEGAAVCSTGDTTIQRRQEAIVELDTKKAIATSGRGSSAMSGIMSAMMSAGGCAASRPRRSSASPASIQRQVVGKGGHHGSECEQQAPKPRDHAQEPLDNRSKDTGSAGSTSSSSTPSTSTAVNSNVPQESKQSVISNPHSSVLGGGLAAPEPDQRKPVPPRFRGVK
ncbi:unnamed protein product, partial [Amoebophrya sp. A25]